MTQNEVRLIWLAPKFPLGTQDGARYATCSLIRSLTTAGVPIDLVCLVPSPEPANPREAEQALGVDRCIVIRRRRSRFFPLPSLRNPHTFRSFCTRQVRRVMQNVLAQLSLNKKCFVLFDGLHTFGALNGSDLHDLAGKTSGIIYRAHNVETVLWEQSASDSTGHPLRRIFLHYQANLVRRFERHVAGQVNIIAPVSDHDGLKFLAMGSTPTVYTVPVGLEFDDVSSTPFVQGAAELNLLFIGRLDWPPNRFGLRWFLQDVWPGLKAARPRTVLKIAGVGDGGWLEAFRNLPGLQLLGKVGTVETLYQHCALAIAPLFQGSGVRVKILEAARFSRPVLSTALGAEGTGFADGECIFLAEKAADWIHTLATVDIAACRQVGQRANQDARERFDTNRIAQQFLNFLKSYRSKFSKAGAS